MSISAFRADLYNEVCSAYGTLSSPRLWVSLWRSFVSDALAYAPAIAQANETTLLYATTCISALLSCASDLQMSFLFFLA